MLSNNDLKKAWVKFISGMGPYSWILHLTFKGEPSAEEVRRIFFGFVRYINTTIYGRRYREKKKGLTVVFVLAPQKRGTLHAHILLGGDFNENIKGVYEHFWNKEWKPNGSIVTKRFQQLDAKNAYEYLVKHIKEGVDIDVSYPPSAVKDGVIKPKRKGIRKKYK